MNNMFKKCFIALSILVLFVLFIVPMNSVLAAPINSNVALPVRKGGFVFRSQIRWLRATDDPTSLNREVNVVAIPNVLVYGATPDLALFAIFPYFFRNVESTDPSSGERIDKNDSGIGDLTLLARYTVYARDYPSGTARFAPLAGIKLPTGNDELEPITTDSVDFQLGGVSTVTWDFGRHEIDADVIYRIKTEAENFEKGDDLVYDLAYEFRVYPWTLPEVGVPNFIYLVAFVGIEHWKVITLHENISNLRWSDQCITIKEKIIVHQSDVSVDESIFGRVKGYVYRRNYDESYYFSTDGILLGKYRSKINNPEVYIQIGNKKLRGGILK